MICSYFRIEWDQVEDLPISEYNDMAEQAMNQLNAQSGLYEFATETYADKVERFRAKIKIHEGR